MTKQCPHCRGRLLKYREIGEEPYLKCLQCSRITSIEPAYSESKKAGRLVELLNFHLIE